MKIFLTIVILLSAVSVTNAQQWYAQEYNLDVDYAMALSGYTKVRPRDQVRFQSPIYPDLYFQPTFVYPQQQYQIRQPLQQHLHLHWCQECRRWHY